MDYRIFANILNQQVFENSKSDLIRKIAETPYRYIGLFRPTKPKAKILQNLLQSNEIRFGDALEIIFKVYFKLLGYENLDNKLQKNYDNLDIDQLFRNQYNIYFVEQKVRDDHDSTKKRGQIDNFIKKIEALLEIYKEKQLKCFTYFIDPSLTKNKNYYSEQMKEISKDYGIYCKLCYGKEFWDEISQIQVWDELLKYLKKWKEGIPELPSVNFDLEAEKTFNEIKDMPPSIYRKLFAIDEIYNEILLTIFPQKKVLKLLLIYFEELGNNKIIYKTLADIVRKTIK
ncbi:MAG: restriction endonuclease [Elusimicrobiota bacterium]|jgi:hypothetical protein|nr:restriction endonuclease [Elusimicrobiota bacterium]